MQMNLTEDIKNSNLSATRELFLPCDLTNGELAYFLTPKGAEDIMRFTIVRARIYGTPLWTVSILAMVFNALLMINLLSMKCTPSSIVLGAISSCSIVKSAFLLFLGDISSGKSFFHFIESLWKQTRNYDIARYQINTAGTIYQGLLPIQISKAMSYN